MTTRWEVERAALAADLLPTSLLLLLILCVLSDSRTATIPARFTPSLSALTRMSGRARSTVCVHLAHLEAEGWIRRHRPTKHAARAEHARTRYSLHIPVIHRAPEPSPEVDEAGPVDGSDLVRPSGGAGPADGHSSIPEPSSTRARSRAWREEAITAVTDTLRDVAPRRTDAHSPEWAARVLESIPLDGVRHRLPYIEAVIRREPDRFLPVRGEPSVAEALAAAIPREDTHAGDH